VTVTATLSALVAAMLEEPGVTVTVGVRVPLLPVTVTFEVPDAAA